MEMLPNGGGSPPGALPPVSPVSFSVELPPGAPPPASPVSFGGVGEVELAEEEGRVVW